MLCLKLDRFGRSLRGILDNIAKLTSLGVRFVVAPQFIDTDKTNPMGQFFINIIGSFAQLERDLIRERTQAGNAKARRNGRRMGRRWLNHKRPGLDELILAATGSPRQVAGQFKVSRSYGARLRYAVSTTR